MVDGAKGGFLTGTTKRAVLWGGGTVGSVSTATVIIFLANTLWDVFSERMARIPELERKIAQQHVRMAVFESELEKQIRDSWQALASHVKMIQENKVKSLVVM